MSSLTSLYASKGDSPGLNTNMGVDYAIHFSIPKDPKERAEAEASFTQLVEDLTKIGLATEVRDGHDSSLLIFVKVASEQYLSTQIYRERVQDWLYGVRAAAPDKDVTAAFKGEPISDAERLRLVYLLITRPKNDGGAGITPGSGRWSRVVSIFPLHDHAFNKRWIKEWSSKYVLTEQELNDIRDRFGEKVAFYFAFLQSYFNFLVALAGFGFASWLILGRYSFLYAVVNSIWTLVFFEWWKQKEVDLAVQWGVRGVHKIQHPRSDFKWDHETADPVTGEAVKVYSPINRFKTQLLQIPFAAGCLVILGAVYLFCLSVEIFISQIYDGPFKTYLVFTPTLILTGVLPLLSTILGNFAEKLTDAENYETEDAHNAALVQKLFFINFITSYTPLFLTAFVYMPFGNLLAPYLDIFRVTAEAVSAKGAITTQSFEINKDRLKNQIVYFTVTAQVVNFLLETIVPIIKRKATQQVEKVTSKEVAAKDPEGEHTFLERVRYEASLGCYDVTSDLREMVVQFGYLSLFSCIWPLAPLSFLINNWIELRSDAMKIAVSSQRPIPWRADSIGPWLNSLGFLSWLGSIVSSAIVFLFNNETEGPGGEPWGIKLWGLLLSILLSEHIYLALQFVVRHVLSQIESPGLQKEKAERFGMRRRMLKESIGEDVTKKPTPPTVKSGEKITRQALEEEAREMSVKGSSPEQAFWHRQQGLDESVQVGRHIFAQQSSNKTAKA
ncbi:hypothetical protein MN608_05209 [Microdochium nivale]|nr:hypothetical protein MN608_05209 [Microdochium nivale]